MTAPSPPRDLGENARELAGQLKEDADFLEYEVFIRDNPIVDRLRKSAALLLSQAEQLEASQKRNVELNTIVDLFQKQIASLQSAERLRDAVIEAARNCISDDRYIDERGIQRGGTMFRGRTSDALGDALRLLTAAEREEKTQPDKRGLRMRREQIVEELARVIAEDSPLYGYGMETSRDAAALLLAKLDSLGLVIVPKEATEEMITAGNESGDWGPG